MNVTTNLEKHIALYVNATLFSGLALVSYQNIAVQASYPVSHVRVLSEGENIILPQTPAGLTLRKLECVTVLNDVAEAEATLMFISQDDGSFPLWKGKLNGYGQTEIYPNQQSSTVSNNRSFATLRHGQKLDLFVDVGTGELILDVLLYYTDESQAKRVEIFNLTEAGTTSLVTELTNPNLSRDINNIIFRNRGTAKPIVTVTIAEGSKTFILHSQDLKEVMPVYDLAGQFAEYAT